MPQQHCGPLRSSLPESRKQFLKTGAKGRNGEPTAVRFERLEGVIPFPAGGATSSNCQNVIRGPGLRKPSSSSNPVDRSRDRGNPRNLRAIARDGSENAGRDGEIRTPDPLNPIQVRYQTAPRPGRRKRVSITAPANVVAAFKRCSAQADAKVRYPPFSLLPAGFR